MISIFRFRTQATNTLTTTNYANVAFDLLPYNVPSATLTMDSNSKYGIYIYIYIYIYI